MVEAEIVSRDGGEVVWLTRVSVSIVSGELNAVLLQVGKVFVNRGLGEVLSQKSVTDVDET